MREDSPGYGILLRLLPRGFRERNGPEMEAVFAEHLEGRSRVGRALVWAAAIWDVTKMAVRLRIGAHGRRRMTTRGWVDGLALDLGFAARSLRRRPGFTLVAVSVLALGIGANATIFSVVDGVLLSPLPYEDAERIGILWHDLGDGAQSLPALNALDLYDYREWSEAFEAFTVATGRERILGGPDDPELVDVGLVEAGFFEFFGAEPALGRSIEPQDDQPGSAPVALLSHRLWSRRYGADPGVLGRAVELAGETHRIVGVLPADFRLHLPAEAFLLTDAEIWTPARIDPGALPPRNFTGFTAFGRIRPGVTFVDAQADLDRMEARLKEIHPVHAASNLQARVVPLHDDVVKQARPSLTLLFGAVALVLVVACANVANLLLARVRSRESELSIRSALGARRGRVVRLVFLESLLLAVLGGGLGVGLTLGALEVVRAVGRTILPRIDGVGLDGSVLAFAMLVMAGAAVVAGLLPALRSASGDPAGVLAHGARAGASRSRTRFRDGLVLAEVAMSVMLLVGAGLMIRSFSALQDVDPGFAPERVLAFRVSLPEAEYPDVPSRIDFRRRLAERLDGLPGVVGVSAVSQLPLTGSGSLQPYAYDEETAANWESVTADERAVDPGFFRTVGATLLAGREFTTADLESGERVVVIDDRLARRAFPEGDATGRRLQVESNRTPEEERYARVVGVVSHLRLHDLARPHLPQIYTPLRTRDRFSVVVRTSGAPETLGEAVRREATAVDPGIPLEDLRPVGALVDDALAPARISLLLMVLFGGVALALASVGLYGVLSFSVRRRTREIGIRMALGQGPGEVRRLVLGRGLRIVLAAILLGGLGALLLSRLASSLLFGVDPADPVTYLAVVGVLLVASLLACWTPARRATLIDPVRALRTE